MRRLLFLFAHEAHHHQKRPSAPIGKRFRSAAEKASEAYVTVKRLKYRNSKHTTNESQIETEIEGRKGQKLS